MPTTRLTQSGAVELPADLRQRLGLLEGDEVVLEERDSGLFLRPVIEKWTQEEIAGYLLNNAITKESYDEPDAISRLWVCSWRFLLRADLVLAQRILSTIRSAARSN